MKRSGMPVADHKLSQVTYNDIKRIKEKISWSQKIKNVLYHIHVGLGNLWENTLLDKD